MKVEEDTILRAIEESVIKPSAEETDQKPSSAGENSQINNSSNILLLSSIMSLDGSIKNFLMANGTTPVVAGKASNEVARTGQKPLGTSTSQSASKRVGVSPIQERSSGDSFSRDLIDIAQSNAICTYQESNTSLEGVVQDFRKFEASDDDKIRIEKKKPEEPVPATAKDEPVKENFIKIVEEE